MVDDCPVKEDVRPEEEAREAVAVAMSCIEKAANDFREGITGKKSKIREEATTKRAAKKDHEAETGEISHVAAAEDDSKKEKTNSEPMSVDDATTEFGKKFEADVLIACFAAQKVFFVDDKHKGLSQDRWKFPVAMPKNCVGEVAENSRVIQVAYNRRNIENTEAVQLYLVNKSKRAVPVTDLLLKTGPGISLEPKIICSRSKQRADQKLSENPPDYRYDLDKDGIVGKLGKANANQYNYLYYVPTYNWDGSGNMPAVAFFSDVKFCDFELSALQIVVTRFFSVLYTEDRVRKVKISAVRAAIGAIMSRNGSHNIGSHVLASLSHNVGTMPDDRVLYQYIQYRMDYIATATTEAPRWAQPTMFVANMMKEFLRQKHLLDHISGSEGLHAYKFQGHSAGGEQENTIRVHVRRINPTELGLKDGERKKWENCGFDGEGQAGVTEFIHYSDAKNGEAKVDISQDIAVAIPGGVIGQHAFYTILENVLRNAAKHEWSQMVKIAKRGHLNLYVDFVDRPEKGSVVCRVWTKGVLAKGEGQSDDDQAKQPQCADQSLLEKMEKKIGSSFVNAAGELMKEDWGIAEMRISAGYLRGCDIANVAGLASPKSALEIIRPVLVTASENRKCLGYCFEINKPRELLVVLSDEAMNKSLPALDEANKTKTTEISLQGKADLAKTTLNVLKKDEVGSQSNVREDEKNAAKFPEKHTSSSPEATSNGSKGEVDSQSNVREDEKDAAKSPEKHTSSSPDKKKTDLDAAKTMPNNVLKGEVDSQSKVVGDKEAVAKALQDKINIVLPEANEKALQYGVEFKTASQVKAADANAYSYVLFEDFNPGDELLTCVPFRTLTRKNGYEGDFFAADVGKLVEKFRKIAKSDKDAREICFHLLEDVYAGWLKHISEVRYGEGAKHPLRLALDIEGEANSSGGRQSLVSDHDLLRFVYEHSFNAAVRSFLSTKAGVSISEECMALLYAVSVMRQRCVASFKELVAYDRNKSVDSVTEDEVNTVLTMKNWVAQVVYWQLDRWFAEILGEGSELNLEKMLSKDDLKRLKEFLGREPKQVLKIGTLKEFYGRAGNWNTILRFVGFIESTILKQAESFLRKYEEEISTMPQGFSKPDDDKKPLLPKWKKVGVSVEFLNDDEKKAKCKNGGAFCYFRHGEQTSEEFTPGYYEALSGAQSGLNALGSYRHDVQCATGSSKSGDLKVELAQNSAARFTARLAENAILRLLIIDERVKKFMDDHDNVKRMLPGLGISVLDHNSPETKLMFPKGEDAKCGAIGAVKIGDKKTGDDKILPMTLSDFEVVIIHQGVIDKLLDGHEDKNVVGKWLEEMNDKLAGPDKLARHYIVITTGRGSPANIPEGARVLPYSVIESSILQRYPEKMILVDTLMNLLPTRRKS